MVDRARACWAAAACAGAAALSPPLAAIAQPISVAKPIVAPLAATPLAAPAALPRDALLDGFAPLPDSGVAWPAPVAATAGDAAAGATGDSRYTVDVQGIGPTVRLTRFRELSALWLARNAPANLAQLNRRAVEDRDLIFQLLRADGHYDGSVETVIVPPSRAAAPTTIVFKVDAGPLYHFGAIDLASRDPGLAARALGLKSGDAVDAAAVAAAQAALPLRLADAGYPFATIGAPDIAIDHAARTATLVQAIDPGRRAVFGRVRFAAGVARPPFDDAHLGLLARLRGGERYNAADLEDLRRALIQTGLIGSARIVPTPVTVAADGSQVVDLVVTIEPAPYRTVSGQLGYSSGQGFRAEATWQHRNFVQPEGAVTVRGVGAEREQLIGGEFRRRNFRKRDVTLIGRASVRAEQQDAYDARTLTLSASIERETNLIWQKKWTYSLGVELTASSERDFSLPGNAFNTFVIAALPGFLTYDGSDNLLDPQRGFRLTGRASPELSYQSSVFTYVKLQVEGSYYRPFGRTVVAVRGHAGTIVGADRGTIAPTRRFYAGGGGSVRGFAYQQVGPKAADGSPQGGSAVIDASFEVRTRFTAFGNDIGIVPFVDVGQVARGTAPTLDGLKVGVGLGLRYFTSFGPVRIDVATPLNPGSNDPRVAFYVSIGQAF